jgi:hypothetical protein
LGDQLEFDEFGLGRAADSDKIGDPSRPDADFRLDGLEAPFVQPAANLVRGVVGYLGLVAVDHLPKRIRDWLVERRLSPNSSSLPMPARRKSLLKTTLFVPCLVKLSLPRIGVAIGGGC